MNSNIHGKGMCFRLLYPGFEHHPFLLKLLITMKLAIILTAFICLQASAEVFSQRVDISVKNAPLGKVIKEIRKQSGYTFFYDAGYLERASRVTMDAQDASVSEALNQAFSGQPFTWEIINKTIIIKPTPVLIENNSLLFIDITGKVTDEKGEPLPGATIRVKGTDIAAAADAEGKFSIRNLRENAVLVISYTGFERQEVVVKAGQSQINIILKEDTQGLNEIVVVGYSNKKKSELTSAVTVVSSDKLKDVTTNDIGSMLQGKVAGLQVVNSSGAPGSTAEIRLRGISSVNASQTPLYVVDGIIGGNYDPNDVESITVLKDAGATAMYGSQANAGVVIVTTKKAKDDKTHFEFKAVTGFRTADFGAMDMMNSSQLYEYQKEFYRDYILGAADNSYKIDIVKFHNERPMSLLDQNTNWLTTMFKPALMQNYYFSAAGKTPRNDYYLGATYYKEKGTFANTDYQRINLRVNSTYHFTDKISLTNNVNLSGSIGKSYDYMDIYYAYLNMPWDNPYNADHNPVYVDGNSAFKWWSRDKINPLHTADNSNHPYKGYDVNYDVVLDLPITPWLTFNSSNRFSVNYNKSSTFYSPLTAGTYHGSGYLNEQSSLGYGLISNQLFKFNFQKGDHAVNGLAGAAIETSRSEFMGAAGKGLPEGLDVLNVISSNQLINGYNERATLQSIISQLNYSYRNKYFLTGSYRIDGSSAFPPGNQYASFPAVSVAWLVSNEDFMNSSKVVDNLKFRLSYGVTGTQDIGASRYLGLYSLASQYNSQTAAIPLQLASPNLTWESKYQFNGGIDIGLFKRLNLTVDVYNNITKDLLLQVSQPLSVGFETRWENVGEVVNNGVELGLSSVNIRKPDFEWSTDFNINFNSNKLRKLPADIIKTGSWGISQIYRNGGNLYEFYLPKWLGVDQQTGAPLWEKVTLDADGKATRTPTSDYASAAPQETGSALPKFQGGFNNEFRYKNFSLRANAYFISGNKVYSNNLTFVMNDGHEPYYNQIAAPDGTKIWTQPGDNATEPSPQNSANSTESSSRYLKDGSYINIRNITLGYQLPQTLVKRLKLEAVKLSLSADNVHTFTDFVGQDPQTTITPGAFITPGVSDFKYPNNRSYLFNINVRF